ncbi:MAG: hypothetical protein OD817_07175 [Gammaproteobacteria bacterium]
MKTASTHAEFRAHRHADPFPAQQTAGIGLMHFLARGAHNSYNARMANSEMTTSATNDSMAPNGT